MPTPFSTHIHVDTLNNNNNYYYYYKSINQFIRSNLTRTTEQSEQDSQDNDITDSCRRNVRILNYSIDNNNVFQ